MLDLLHLQEISLKTRLIALSGKNRKKNRRSLQTGELRRGGEKSRQQRAHLDKLLKYGYCPKAQEQMEKLVKRKNTISKQGGREADNMIGKRQISRTFIGAG